MCILQVSGDPSDGSGSQQHRQVSEADRRPRAVPHLPDPAGLKGNSLISRDHQHVRTRTFVSVVRLANVRGNIFMLNIYFG